MERWMEGEMNGLGAEGNVEGGSVEQDKEGATCPSGAGEGGRCSC